MSVNSSRFDSAIGWSTRPDAWVSRGVRVLLSALAVILFCGPLLVIFSGAFDHNPDPTKLSVIPDNPSLINFKVAGENKICLTGIDRLVGTADCGVRIDCHQLHNWSGSSR